MSAARHTPGPWQYYEGVVDAPINGTSPPTVICERISARERGYGTLAERQAIADADGRLIAAAPDLLAALSLAGKFLADNYVDADMPDILPAVRAALAKVAP